MRCSLATTLLLIVAAGTAYGQNSVSLTQRGTNNSAQAAQAFAGTQGPNTLTITQVGIENTAVVTQDAPWHSAALLRT
jgi:hypothetical protein